MSKWKACLFLVIAPVVFCGISFLLLRHSLKSEACAACRSIASLCCKPGDYNLPLVNGIHRIHKGGSEIEFSLSPKYYGKHVVYLNEIEPLSSRVSVKAFTCMNLNGPIELNRVDQKIYDAYGDGEAVAYFQIDADLIKKVVHCKVSLQTEVDQLIRMRVVKLSDL